MNTALAEKWVMTHYKLRHDGLTQSSFFVVASMVTPSQMKSIKLRPHYFDGGLICFGPVLNRRDMCRFWIRQVRVARDSAHKN
jgi:hypothetical protein